MHLAALARDRTGKASGVPITVIFSRPDGVEHSRVTLTDQGQGGRATTLALAGSAMTGTWRAKIHTDPKSAAIAQASFLVEDFVPERLDLKLEPAVQALSPQEPGTIKLAGRYLYGPPAAGLAVEGEIAVKLAKGDLPGFAGYKFGLADEQVAPVRKPLEGLPATDAEGKADIAVLLPALPKTSRPLEADVILKLRESGGRTIERTVTLPVDLKAPRIGIRPLFKGGQAEEGEPARFEAILLGADGKAVDAKGLKWELMRLENRWQWYSRDGSWNFESADQHAPHRHRHRRRRRRRAGQDRGQGRLGPLSPRGQHRRRLGPRHLQHGVQRRLLRRRGRRQPRGARRRPRQAVLQGGRDGARQDRLAHGRPRAHRRDELRAWPARRRSICRPAAARCRSASATTGAPAPTSPSCSTGPWTRRPSACPRRALGLRWLAIDQAPRMLNVRLDAPEKVKSGSTLTVPVKIAGLVAGEEARITVAATDVGILNLTRFEPPKPQDWFFGQRRLGTEIRDVYGRLIDGMRAERGTLRSGGDGSAGGMAVQGSPPVEATLALFSGIVKVGADGTAQVEFQMPDFNGTVRLSAVAWSADKVGSASQGRDRARSRGAHRLGPALPHAGRQGAARAGRSTTSKARRAPTPSPASTSRRRAPSRSRASSARLRSTPASASARPSS